MNPKRILILGIDGYIGWPLALHLLRQGHIVSGLDNFSRRDRASNSITPIQTRSTRVSTIRKYGNFKSYHIHDLAIFEKMHKENPDIIIHLAEQPSAPWSMQSYYHASKTQQENVLGTLKLLWLMREHCPDAHLIKLGTMGEYGKPDCDIPEGEIPNTCLDTDALIYPQDRECPLAGLPFPKSPNSFYHLSKVHDTNNIIFACKTWGLSCTDIMQGVVFGLMDKEPELLTRFDYDEFFGTAINRFCAQAIVGHPLTIYGSGNQTYSFLPLKDSIQCIDLILNNTPQKGEYRVFNQFEGIYSINLLANLVYRIAKELNLPTPSISSIPNPRTEPEDHYYNPSNRKLLELGYKPSKDLEEEIKDTISVLVNYKNMVNEELIMPKTTWR